MTILEILRQLGIPFLTEGHEHCRKGWIQIDCPFCGLRGHWRMGVNVHHGYTNCWTCGSHTLVESLCTASGIHRRTILSALEDLSSVIDGPERRGEAKRLSLPHHRPFLMRPHKNYLKGRGLNPDEIERVWDARSIGISNRLSWRILIPIYHKGEIVSWTTRSIGSSVEKRYINAPSKEEKLRAKNILYGEDKAHHSIIIVEGPIDVWKIGPGAVATMGTGYTREQALRMTGFPRRAICFDAEKEAQKRASRLCKMLSLFPGETYNIILDSKDPGEASTREINTLKEFLQ